MSDDNVKWIDIGEKMVKQMLEKKQKEHEKHSFLLCIDIKEFQEKALLYLTKIPRNIWRS